MALKPKYKRRGRAYYSILGKNATIVASDTTRSFTKVYYVIRVDGENKDRYDVSESELDYER